MNLFLKDFILIVVGNLVLINMCQRFINEFVHNVIKKLKEDKECPYVVMYIDDDDVTYEPPYMISYFYATKKSLAASLYDKMIKESSYTAYIINYIITNYPNIINEDLKKWFIFWGDMTIDQYDHICEIFDQNKGKEIFQWLDDNVGLFEIFDNLRVKCGRICLLRDTGYVFYKLYENGLSFR